MNFKPHLPQRQARYLAASLALFLFSVYLLIYRGGFHSIDEVSMFAVTESLVKFGRLNTDQIAWTQWTTSQAEAQGFFGRDGHVYSKKGLALSLAQAPLYGLALLLPGLGMLQTVSLLNALVTAATALLLFMFVWRLGFSPAIASGVALIFGLATIAAVYAKYLFSEPLAGFLLLLAAYMLLAYRQEGGNRHLIIAGLAAGAAVLARANNLFLLPVFGLYLLWGVLRTGRRSGKLDRSLWVSSLAPVATFLLALAIPGAILLSYNALRSGNPLQTGYDLTLFSANFSLGLYKLLFSPLRGLFIYSPILLLSLPGWLWLRRSHPAEAWLLAGLVMVTLTLFSFWSSGEGLSWGSRFLVPLIPFFTICLAPVMGSRGAEGSRTTHHVSRLTFYILLPLSLLIQLLGVTINPWVFLSQLQANFGGEFFLENTPALYDLRYSQIVGQLQNWSVQHSDLAWWQPWGFDGLAFGLSLLLVFLSAWLLGLGIRGQGSEDSQSLAPSITHYALRTTHYVSRLLFPLVALLALLIPYLLLLRYYQTDRQFGPPEDAYTQALRQAGAKAGAPVITVAQYHYHIPMNRFKARVPLVGFAQQRWPLPEAAVFLLSTAGTGQIIPLVTVGFPPAAPDNGVEQWLARHTFKASDEWFPDEVRLVQFSSVQPAKSHPLNVSLGETMRLDRVKLPERGQAGTCLPVEFQWQVVRPPEVDYHLFLQLLNAQGALVAQQDTAPNGGYNPTSTWRPGQPLTSRQALILPADLPPGDYRLITGLYNPATGARLLTASGADFVELGNIAIIGTE